MKIEVEKVFQSPCTPVSEVDYLLKVTFDETVEETEDEKKLVEILEKIVHDNLITKYGW